MWLTAWLRASRQPARHSRKKGPRRYPRRAYHLSIEALEDRTLLTTKVFLDFGLGLPAAGLPTKVAGTVPFDSLANIIGMNTGANLAGPLFGLKASDDLTFRQFSVNFDGQGGQDVADIIALQAAVLPIVQRAFEPFDIKVETVSSANFAGILRTTDRNKDDATGEFDVYVFLGILTSSARPGDGSVSFRGAEGITGGNDFSTGKNLHDEVSLVFADDVKRATSGSEGSPEFRRNFALEMANTAIHEAGHGLGLGHTLAGGSNQDERLLSGSDVMLAGGDGDEIFTRFDIEYDPSSGKTGRVNNYEQLRDDGDIGLRDVNRNSFGDVPDFAYVTGTGAHDRITLLRSTTDPNIIQVIVTPFRDPAHTLASAIGQSETYSITVGKAGLDGTEGPIRIDAGDGNDEIIVSPNVNLDVTVYGGAGDDTISVLGTSNDHLYGERGNDTIRAGGGSDVIWGGEDNDTLEGGDGTDILYGEDGNDTLRGQGGTDFLYGGDGTDTLEGGATDESDQLYGERGNDTLDGGGGNDYLSGGEDTDTLHGGAGEDTLDGGPGIDSVDGGPGIDTIHDPQGEDRFFTTDPGDKVIGKKPPARGSQRPPPQSSATGALSSAQVAALKVGLNQLVAWAGSVGGQLAVGTQQVATILADTFQRGMVGQVLAYLDSTPSPTIEGTVARLKNLSSSTSSSAFTGASNASGGLVVSTSNVAAVTATNTVRWDLYFEATRSSTTLLDHLFTADKGIQVSQDLPQVPLLGTFGLDLSFGLGAGGFFIQLPAAGIQVSIDLEASDLALPVNVGLLGAETEGAWVRMNSLATVAVNDANHDGLLTPLELTAAGTSLSRAGTLFAEFPYQSQLGTTTEAGVVTITDEDLADSQTQTVRLAGTEEVQQLAGVNAFAVVGWLKSLAGWLDQASSAAQLVSSLPFTDNLKLNKVADFATTLRTQVLDLLVNLDGTPNFHTAQELLARLASAAGVGPSLLGLGYDPGSRDLTFQLNFGKTFAAAAPLALNFDFARLGGVQFDNPQVQFQAAVSASLLFGLNLAPVADGSDVLDRFFLRDTSFDAAITASITGVNGSAHLGIFDLALVGGHGELNLAVGLDVTAQSGLDSLTVSPHLSGSANLTLPVQLAVEIAGLTLPAQTGVVINWANITDPSTLSVKIEPEADLSGLLDSLESVAMAQVVEGLKRVVHFLRDAQSQGVFQQKIPVLNRSLADLLDTAEALDALSKELETHPPTTIGQAVERLKQALGSAGNLIRFQDRVLEIDLSHGFNKTLNLDLGFDLADQLNAGILEEFLDVNGSAAVTLSVGAAASLGLVIDLSNPSSPEFAIKDSSNLTLTTLVSATGINLEASIGPLGAFIRDGHISLDNGTLGQPATWTVSLATSPSGRYQLADLISNAGTIVHTDAVGRLDVDLPVSFPTADETQGSIHLTIGDLGHIAATTALDQDSLPDFARAIGNLDLGDLIGLVIEGLDRALTKIEGRFDLPNLPLIGDHLANATGFLRDIRENVISKLEGLSELTAAGVRAKLFEALGPSFLADRNGDHRVTADDVRVDFSVAQKRADIDFTLAGSYSVGTPINLDLGLDGLGLEMNGDLSLTIRLVRFDVGFGVSADDGFYLHTGAAGSAPELQIALEAAVSSPAQMAQLTAELGFLQFTATDTPITQPDGGKGSYFSGILTLDLIDPGTGTHRDGHLTLAEMESSDIEDVLQSRLDLDANVQLHLAARISSDVPFPHVEADFEFRWQYDTNTPATNGVQTLGFKNVRMNLADLVGNTINPILEKVNAVLGPFVQIAEVLGTRLPVISDLAGQDYTLLDLARDFGTINQSTYDFVERVLHFGTFASSVRTVLNGLVAAGGWLELGSFTLDATAAADAGKLGKLAPVATVSTNFITANLDELKDEQGFSVPVLTHPASLFKLLMGQDILLVTYDMPRLDFAFQYKQFFPIVGPLGVTLDGRVGAAADLKFGYDTRGLRQFAAGGYDDPELILNGLYISDTDHADGSGKDVPELELTASIQAFVTVNLGFAEFGGGGGLKANVAFDLNDPDHDGRMYLQEIVGAFSSDNALRRLVNISGGLSAVLTVYAEVLLVRYEKELAEVKLLDFSPAPPPEPDPVLGEVDAQGVLRLNMGPRAGERLYRGATDGDEQFTIAAGANPGEVTVTFNTWTQTFAGVTYVVADGGAGDDTITVDAGLTLEVQLRGGEGNDTLQAGGGPATLLGGPGNDHLVTTTHPGMLDGEEGDDTLEGGALADVLHGGDGNDTIHGGGDDDQIEGGAGDDILQGDAGADMLSGDDGQDVLYGGTRPLFDDVYDTMPTGDGPDRLFGARGNDTLHGGDGADTLSGGEDDDIVFGGTGDDLLQGDAGDDELHGGDGNDALEGGRGNDSLFGEADLDKLLGSLGGDYLDGGTGADDLNGGVGADDLHGGYGDDSLEGEAGADILFGDAGDDLLQGGIDNDVLSGGDGNDTLQGGGGDDQLFGFGWLQTDGGTRVSNGGSRDGDDLLLGGEGDDALFGGRGADILQGEEGADLIDGESGEDRIQFAVTLVDTNLDTLKGGPHRDVIEVLGTDAADDLTVRQLNPTTFLVERRDTATGPVTATFRFTLPADPAQRDIELLWVSGLGGDDVIRAVGTFNVNQVQLDGGAGNDRLEGSASDDLLKGGAGDDTLLGNAGRDELYGGEGADLLQGGADSDALYGEAGDDTLQGEAGADLAFGGAGSDRLEAGEGVLGDIMYGDTDDAEIGGNDTLIGGDGVDVMFGGLGADRLEGRGSSDILHGDAGDDVLVGGTGRDLLGGDDGADKLYGLFEDATAEATLPTNWQTIDDELFARETAIREERQLVDEKIDEIQRRISNLGEEETPVPVELQMELDRLQQRQFDLANARAVLNLQEIDSDPVQTVQVDILLGGPGDDTLRGSNFGDRLSGDSGDDIIEHTTGADVIFGGEHVLGDLYRIRGTENADTIVIRLEPGGEITAPQVVITINGVSTRVSHLEIEVASVLAMGGNDTVTVDFGQNAAMKVDADGGAGNDRLDASTFQNDATFRGGAGDDVLTGGVGDDRLEGGDGNDVITGGDGIDTILGGAGNDTLTGGNGGDTLIDGGAGTDRLVENVEGTVSLFVNALFQLPSSSGTSVTDGLAGLEEVYLTGSEGPDFVSAAFFPGKVTLLGKGGNDTLIGGPGADVIDGGAGDDTITGGPGNDVLIAGEGLADKLIEWTNADFVLTSTALTEQRTIKSRMGAKTTVLGRDKLSGFEVAQLSGGDGSNRINASGFIGVVILSGGGGNDALTGGNFSDTLAGGEGNDVLHGGNGNDLLIGGLGNDFLYGEAGRDTLHGDEVGTSTPTDGADTLDGGAEDDVLWGGGGADTLLGQGGNDVLKGGDGNDLLKGGTGNDTLSGELGNDTLHGDDLDVVKKTPGIPPSGNDSLDGGDGDDVLWGYGGIDTLQGGYGTDELHGGSGDDTLRGGDGTDKLFGDTGVDTLEGDTGDDWMYGGAGNDRLFGGAGQDRLDGEVGDDYLDGGDDDVKDTLYGGAGRDTFLNYYTWRRVFDPVFKVFTWEKVFQENLADYIFSLNEDTRTDVET